MSLPCPYQGDVEYAFEQLESGSFVASVSVAALEPIAGYPELKKAGRSGKIREDRGRKGGREVNSSSNRRPLKRLLKVVLPFIHRRFVAHMSHSK